MSSPRTYLAALLMMLLSMLCCGSWANTQKIDKTRRFELFYWDYLWGVLACALLFGLTLGRTNPAASVSFVHNLDHASARSLIEAFGERDDFLSRELAFSRRDFSGWHDGRLSFWARDWR